MGWVFKTMPRALYPRERPKLEYVSNVWNSITCTVAKKIESIQQNFIGLCQNHLCLRDRDNKDDFLIHFIELLSLCGRRLHFIVIIHFCKKGKGKGRLWVLQHCLEAYCTPTRMSSFIHLQRRCTHQTA